MTVIWRCKSCPFETQNPRVAFLHRNGEYHHVHPYTANPLTGIDRHTNEETIDNAYTASKAPDAARP